MCAFAKSWWCQNRNKIKLEYEIELNYVETKQKQRILALTLLSFSVTVKLRYTYFDLHTLPSDDEIKLKKQNYYRAIAVTYIQWCKKRQKTTSHRIENSSSLKLMSQIRLSLVPKILKRKKLKTKITGKKQFWLVLISAPPPSHLSH